METVSKPTSHNAEVARMINAISDRDIQDEMLNINKSYLQVIAGLRLAKNYLEKLDDETGLDHSEFRIQIAEMLGAVRSTEIGVLELIGNW